MTYRPHVIKQPNGRFAIFYPELSGITQPNWTREVAIAGLTRSNGAANAEAWVKEAEDDTPTDWSCPTAPKGYGRWEGAIAKFKDKYGRAEHDEVCAEGFRRP